MNTYEWPRGCSHRKDWPNPVKGEPACQTEVAFNILDVEWSCVSAPLLVHFWRMSRRIASFLILSTYKIEDVSQNCFVFDVVKFKNCGRLAELLRFWCCQVQKLSTAQGGGGSFKNRKPIREVRCCESRMAERSHWWTERWFELCFLEWLQWLQWSPHHNCWM